MKKQQKKRIDELINLLGQAQEQIINSVRNNELRDAEEILVSCQNVAISIGTAIEDEEGEGTKTVALLEEYCEAIFQFSEMILSGENISVEDVSLGVVSTYKKVCDSYTKEIVVLKEAVFMPYNASMWDSLESVWKEYDADPKWNAVVMPIPYFDRNADGTFKEAHYEGDLLPEYVPVVSYRNYSLQEMHPDVIFIHNPYDDRNTVTTVHPDYYSSKIKEYTDKLVYIPYFVLAECDPSEPAAVEFVSHFSRVPGVFNADEVIVQSENMKKCYVESLVQLFGEETRSHWETTIKGTGSPKLQKMSHIADQKFVYPTDWINKITREDGSRKKVIFYNTSIQALLDHENILDKMQYVINVFRERKNDVVLLWRPHPLLEATIKSMRPELVGQYEKIVRDYKAENIGIFDDSADLYRAIAISDAYYGDHSSVVELFKEAKIPIMIQNPDIMG